MNLKLGFDAFLSYQNTLERANKLGFTFGRPKYSYNNEDNIGLFPLNDDLPIYVRDAMLACGDLTQIQAFLAGVEFARNYDEMMKVSSDKTRAKKEHEYRKNKMFKQLKDEVIHEIQG